MTERLLAENDVGNKTNILVCGGCTECDGDVLMSDKTIENMIPDKRLRKNYCLCYDDLKTQVLRLGDEPRYWNIVFHKIAYLSGICNLIPKFSSSGFLIDFLSASDIEEALNFYVYSEEFIYWLLEEMLKAECNEGIVVLEREIARMGLNRTPIKTRFSL